MGISTEQVQGRTTSLWRNRNFTAFWLGETVSQVGGQVALVALPLTAVLVLDVSTTELGLLRFAEYLPFLAFTLFFGAWADRRRRRPLMVVSNVVRGVLVALVPLLAALDLLTLPLLIAVAFAVGTGTALFGVCWLSYVPGLVGRSRLVDAMGKMSASHAAAEVAGPGIGGLLVQLVTAPFALVLDALSYVVSVISLLAIRYDEPEPISGKAAQRHLRRELAEGLKFAMGEPHIRATAIAAALGNFFAVITETIFLLYAVRELNFSVGLVGLTLTAIGAGDQHRNPDPRTR